MPHNPILFGFNLTIMSSRKFETIKLDDATSYNQKESIDSKTKESQLLN